MLAISQRLITSKALGVVAGKSVRSLSLGVRFHKHGEPEAVFKLEKLDEATVKKSVDNDEVALKFLASTINPSDFNIATGVYGTLPPLPAFGGNEGVAEVVQVGSSVTGLQKGDWVLPLNAPFGCWRQHAHAKASELVKISNDIEVPYAASLAINPSTAYRLLKDFENLQPGDWVIQNGANSMVGQAVVQLARLRGLKTINVVRYNRPEVPKMVRMLDSYGGDINISSDYLGSGGWMEIAKDLPPIKLGLNCVGGSHAINLARALAPGGTLVTYGNMSKEALAVPADLVAAKQLKLKGFWIAEWYKQNTVEARQAMFEELIGYIRTDQLSFFFEVHDFDDFDWALTKAREPFRFRKVVLDMCYPDRMKEHDAKPESDYDVFEVEPYQ